MDKALDWPHWHQRAEDDVVRFHTKGGAYFDVRVVPDSNEIEIRGMSDGLDLFRITPQSGNSIRILFD